MPALPLFRHFIELASNCGADLLLIQEQHRVQHHCGRGLIAFIELHKPFFCGLVAG
jgi:hypothetical protein